MFFVQLDDMLDLVKYEQAELHRQAARDALAAEATLCGNQAPRAHWWARFIPRLERQRDVVRGLSPEWRSPGP
jgi:hypothetical protein